MGSRGGLLGWELVGKSWERAGSVEIWDFVIIIRHCIHNMLT